MQYSVLLDKNENVRDVEAEEQTKFVMTVIEALGIPFEWNSNEPLSPLDRLRIKKLLNQYNISIIDDMGGNIKIYLERELIAEWYKSSYILKEDNMQIDPKKRLFIEMKCSFWSKLEEEEVNPS